MEFLALILIFYFLVGACVCLLVCVNPNQKGILGAANRFVFRTLPQVASKITRKIFGEGIIRFFGNIKHYFMQTNHPVVQIFYLLIAVGGFILYEILGIFKHMPNPSIGDAHVIAANVLAMICFWVYYKACAVGPGEVTAQNVKQCVQKHQRFYDEILYLRNNKCRTCELVKPARSKHCSICQMCVSCYDHHCVWIRQCVGEYNYKYFISFLFMHSVWCIYLSIIGTISLLAFLDRIKFWEILFSIDGMPVKASPLIAFQYLLMNDTIFLFLNVMCAIMGFTLLIFVMYHFYLVSEGQTTNERVKKNDEIAYYQKQIKAIDQCMKKAKEGQQIFFKEIKTTQKQLVEHRAECSARLAILENKGHNAGFWANLKEIFLR